jgi:hypothetical protein
LIITLLENPESLLPDYISPPSQTQAPITTSVEDHAQLVSDLGGGLEPEQFSRVLSILAWDHQAMEEVGGAFSQAL